MKEASPPVSAMATPTNSSGNLVDEFEEAFQHCLNVLTKDEAVPSMDKDEIRVEVEQTTLRFVDLARQMEAFFLQKRFLLSALKPEMVIKEDINELRLELGRKDELLKRHYEKVAVWQNLLADLQGYAKSPATSSNANVTNTNASAVGLMGHNGNVPTGQGSPMVGGPMTAVGGPSASGAPGMVGGMVGAGSATSMQHAQQLHQMQQQQQHMQQMQQMQVPPGMGGGGVGVVPGMVSPQQAMFMQQQGMASGRSPFGGQGPSVLQGPLAYLEKTTSNIDLVAGMTDGRR